MFELSFQEWAPKHSSNRHARDFDVSDLGAKRMRRSTVEAFAEWKALGAATYASIKAGEHWHGGRPCREVGPEECNKKEKEKKGE